MLASSSRVQKTSIISQPDEPVETLLEDFVHSVAHELREPLRTVGMFSELLALEGHLDENSRRYSQLIIDSVRRMSSVLDGLSEIALSGRAESVPALDLTRVVNEAILNLGHAVRSSQAVINVGSLPFVKGNEKQLLRIVQNLIANAIKYCGDAPIQIEVTAEWRGTEWMISIRDTGIGIAPEYQAQIFQLFARLHGRSISGAGIGLAVCRRMIESMGGTIWVESKPGLGSVFCFTVADAVSTAKVMRFAVAAGS